MEENSLNLCGKEGCSGSFDYAPISVEANRARGAPLRMTVGEGMVEQFAVC